jgi:tRNA A-37 threonylcarbamoyl transferase component Bud32
MEYCDGGSLYELLKDTTFEEEQIAFICREVLGGLKYLHDKNQVHRDIKSDNILVALSGEIKIGMASMNPSECAVRNAAVPSVSSSLAHSPL